jgi:NADH dehydrogenase
MILVAGATGQLGGSIARALLTDGQKVKVLVREGSSWQPLEIAGAQIVMGDLKSPDSLGAACQDVDVVITTANSAQRGGADNTQSVDTDGNRHLIDAARASGVKQFIFVSAVGVTIDSPVPLFEAKARTEAYLRASGMPFTILAPDVFMDVWIPMVVGPALGGHAIAIIGEGRRRHSFVAIRDVVAFAVATIGRPEALNRQIPLGGPDAVSWRDVVGAFERRLGRTLPIVSLAPGQPLPGLPASIGQLMAGLDTYDSIIPMTETAREFGVAQTSLDQFVLSMFGTTEKAAAGGE